MTTRNKMGSEQIDAIPYNGKTYHVFGCWDEETPKDEYDFYDVFCEGECINLGEPFWERPNSNDIAEHLQTI